MQPRPLVVVTDFITEPLEIERSILGEVADVVAVNAFTEADLIGQVEQATALMVYHAIGISAETLQRLQQCQLIVRCGVGIDNVDGRLAREKGITLANVPDYGTEEVADSAIALTLSLTRGTHVLNQRLQRGLGEWSYTQVVPLQRLRGQVFAIIGLGRIGIATALRAKAHGFDVVFYDPYQPQGMDKTLGIRRAESLAELVKQAYVLSVHCPLTSETDRLVNAELLAKLPAGGYLINTARGGVVDAGALLEALTSGHLAGAGIDVLVQEPPDPADPLLQAWRNPDHPAFDRLILNPHAAFYCEQGLADMRIKGSQNCLRVLQGLPPVNRVN